MIAIDSPAFEAELAKIIGTPYEICGSDLDGMDCSGLVKYVYALQGIELTNTLFSSSVYCHKAIAREFKAELASDRWVKVDHPSHGGLVGMGNSRVVNHCGIWFNGDQILHATGGVGAAMQSAQSLKTQKGYTFRYYQWQPST